METETNKKIYGLIGKNISYSFSRTYFNNKFKESFLPNCIYTNFDFNDNTALESFLNELSPEIKGLNATIPYKETVASLVDEISPEAKEIGAVNCIEITNEGKKIGHNTDWIGFSKSLAPLLKNKEVKALVLGTGGASKAVQFALKNMNIPYLIVSRTSSAKSNLTYGKIDEALLKNYNLIINCTPLGTFPNIDECPEIPYHYLNKNNIVYDLVYNPRMTKMMKKSDAQGAMVKNGFEMLTIQAEENWKIWNNDAEIA